MAVSPVRPTHSTNAPGFHLAARTGSGSLSLVLVSMGNLCHVKIIHVVLQLGGVINELLHIPRVTLLRCIRACTLNVCALKEENGVIVAHLTFDAVNPYFAIATSHTPHYHTVHPATLHALPRGNMCIQQPKTVVVRDSHSTSDFWPRNCCTPFPTPSGAF